MSARIYHGRERVSSLPADDRGLAYGDGLFETYRVHDRQLVWWDAHWRRLARGALALNIPLPDQDFLRSEAEDLIANSAPGVFKLVLTRGGGARGYAAPPTPTPTVLMSCHPLSTPVGAPLHLRMCRTRLAIQPDLAGIKHLNRLEQVLARNEWSDPEIHDGLMCDTEGRVVCATAGNLFARINGRWFTPSVTRCGVAGVMREWLLAQHPDMVEAELHPEQLQQAQALFVCNAVRGIQPVAWLQSHPFPPSTDVTTLRAELAAAVPAFANA